MKVLYILLFLLLGLKPAISDSTLIFKNFTDTNSWSNNYYLKNGQLRLLEERSKLFNIYKKSKQSFISFNPKSGKTSRIDSTITDQRVETLNQQRMQKVAGLEKQLNSKLKKMNDTEKKVGESLINQLKYPELYGSHTLLRIIKTKQSKSINKISCDVYRVLHKNTEVKSVCIANNQSLKLAANDYNTLLNFYHFNYTIQTRLMLAMGKTDFNKIDYKQENIDGIPIEIINTRDKGNKLELMLVNVSRKKLDKTLFSPPKP